MAHKKIWQQKKNAKNTCTLPLMQNLSLLMRNDQIKSNLGRKQDHMQSGIQSVSFKTVSCQKVFGPLTQASWPSAGLQSTGREELL